MERKTRWFNKPDLQNLKEAITQSWKDKEVRLWKRLKAVWMYLQGFSPDAISNSLDVGRRSLFYWMERYQADGIEGLQEGDHPGRPPGLSARELERLPEIIDSGPIAYGFSSGVWTSSRVGYVIQEEFGKSYHKDHIRKILHQMGFSVQRPTKTLAKADPAWQQRWVRHTYPRLKKTPKPKKG
jgi:transposase